jgi:hypothetical protein
MIPERMPNTVTRPYRGLSVQEVDAALTEAALLGREVYRRTEYLVLRNGDDSALVAVRRAEPGPLFSPVVEARVLAAGDQVAWIQDPATDVTNATAMAGAALTKAMAALAAAGPRPGPVVFLVSGGAHPCSRG